MSVENCSGLTWVLTSNKEVACTKGVLKFGPGRRGVPVTLPRVVTTATVPAGTMKIAWLIRIRTSTKPMPANCNQLDWPPKGLEPEDCMEPWYW